MTRITLVGEFEFRLVDEVGQCVASTTIVGARDQAGGWAVAQLLALDLDVGTLERRLPSGAWFQVARCEP